jgi:hypothetical protein
MISTKEERCGIYVPVASVIYGSIARILPSWKSAMPDIHVQLKNPHLSSRDLPCWKRQVEKKKDSYQVVIELFLKV